MQTRAVVLQGPERLGIETLTLDPPGSDDVVVGITHSGISTGTEKLFWSGRMPPFPGMGYPLVPGYEATGEVIEAPRGSSLRAGDAVFVPGAACYGDVRGLFGAAASTITTGRDRLLRIDGAMGAEGALFALAATARHAMAGLNHALPDLIVGHGVVGKLLARLTLAAGAPAPTVWETDPARREATDYPVIDPATDERRDYACIYDASGDATLIDTLVGRLARGGEIVLCGFYPDPISFAYPAAFMREARLRVAAEWTRDDLVATRALVEGGALSLAGLITHTRPAADAAEAYRTAFTDSSCLKMVLDWKGAA